MWSHIWGYYEIRASASYDETVPTNYLKHFLCSLPELKEDGPLVYVSAPDFPGVRITIVKTDNGNWSVGENTWFNEINLIDVLLTKQDGQISKAQLDLAVKITEFLGWELVETQ